tara:strand:+ start:823 stop:1062 length:240 start_codon:yes stop_codon:yes gene_type:complete
MDDENWRQDYLNTKVRLNKKQIQLLKEGPKSWMQAVMLGVMHREWERMNGIKPPPTPPDCSSNLKESLKLFDEMDKGNE